jgi:hypothetical protein
VAFIDSIDNYAYRSPASLIVPLPLGEAPGTAREPMDDATRNNHCRRGRLNMQIRNDDRCPMRLRVLAPPCSSS